MAKQKQVYFDVQRKSDSPVVEGIISTASAIATFSLRSFLQAEEALYDFFKQVQKGDDFSKGAFILWSEFMQFKEPYTFIMILGLLYVILFPIVSVAVFLNRNCYVRCCGNDLQTEAKVKSSCRKVMCAFIICATITAIFGAVTVLFINTNYDKPIENSPNIVNNFSVNMTNYLNSVEEQLKLYRQELNEMDFKFRLQLDRGEGNTTKALPTSLPKSESNEALETIKKLQHDLQYMENDQERLANEISNVRYSIVKSLNIPICEFDESCRKMVVFATVTYPDMSSFLQLSKLQEWARETKEDMKGNNREGLIAGRITLQQGNVSSGNIPEEFRQHILEKWVEVKNEISVKLTEYSDTGLKMVRDGFSIFLRSDNQHYFLSVLKHYQWYRYYASDFVATTAVISSLLFWMGIVFGSYQHQWMPSSRRNISQIGGKIMFCSATLSLLITWIILILLLIVFTFGCFTEKYFCQNIDEPYVAYKFLVRLRFSEVQKNSNISLDELMQHCKEDHSLYQAFGLNQVELQELKNTLLIEKENFENMTEANRAVSRRVREIKPVFDANLELASFIAQSKKKYENARQYIDKLDQKLTSLNFQNGLPTEYSNKLRKAHNILRKFAERLESLQQAAELKFERMQSSQITIAEENEHALRLATGALSQNVTDSYAVEDIVNDMTDFLDKFLTKVTNELGACKQLYIGYATMATLICDNVVDIANGTWLSWLIVVVILIITSFVGIRMSFFYKRKELLTESKSIEVSMAGDEGSAASHENLSTRGHELTDALKYRKSDEFEEVSLDESESFISVPTQRQSGRLSGFGALQEDEPVHSHPVTSPTLPRNHASQFN